MNLGLFPVLGKTRATVAQPGDTRVWPIGAVASLLPATIASTIDAGKPDNTFLIPATGLYKLRLGNTVIAGNPTLSPQFYRIPATKLMVSANAELLFTDTWNWSATQDISKYIYLNKNDRVYLAATGATGAEPWAANTYLGISPTP